MQKRAKCSSQLLSYKRCKLELQFLQKGCMEKFICLSNNVHFQGILHAKESQVSISATKSASKVHLPFQSSAFSRYTSCKRMSSVSPNFLLIKLANSSSNFCKMTNMKTLVCLSNNLQLPGILHATGNQVFLPIACL